MLLLLLVPSLALLGDDASNSTDVNASDSEAFPVDFSESESELETSEPESITEEVNETTEFAFETTTEEWNETTEFALETTTEEWNETTEFAFETTTEEALETSETEPETATEDPVEPSEPEIESPSSEAVETSEVETAQEPTEEPTPAPTPVPPTRAPDYGSDEACMCAGDECRRCEAQQLGFAQMNDFLENARSDELEIEIRGSSAENRVPVSAKSIAGNRRLEELKFEGKGTGYVELEFDGASRVTQEVEFSRVDVEIVVSGTGKVLAQTEVEIDRLKLQNSPLHGENVAIHSQTIETDLTSVAGMTTRVDRRYEIDAPNVEKVTVGSEEIVIQSGSQTTTVVNYGNSGDIEIETKTQNLKLEVPPGTKQIHSKVVLSLESKATVNVTGWSEVENPFAFTIDSGRNAVEVVTDSDEAAKHFSFKGSGTVTVNGEVVKKGGLSTGAIIAIAVVCLLVIIILSIVVAVLVAKKRRKKIYEYRTQVDEPINMELEPI